MKITVLGGAGAMGQVVVRDLAESPSVSEVLVADYNAELAGKVKAELKSSKVEAAGCDIRDLDKTASLARGSDVLINASPYTFNLAVMEAALKANCHYLDLGGLFHMTRRQLELDERFRQKNLLAVLGMGCAPGLTNVMAACGADELETVESIDIAIGCVDFVKVDQPFYLPSSYGLDTVLEEYTKESMVFSAGKFVQQEPMSGELEIDFPQPVGRKRAIFTLHSEVATLPLTYEKKGIERVTFRLGLPDEVHEKLKFLVSLGLADAQAVEFPEGKVSPRKVLARVMERFPAPAGDPNNCEVVRVDVAGTLAGAKALVRLETTVYSHPGWKLAAGALDTGVPPSIVAQMIAAGHIKERGVLPPERCVPAQMLFDELARRSIVMRKISERSLVRGREAVAGR